jgi:branched-chain amino acid transport system permease protein
MSDGRRTLPSVTPGVELVIGIAVIGGLIAFVSTVAPVKQDMLVSLLLFAFFAVTWDIIGGWGGQVSLCQSIFIGAGAYSTGVLSVHAQVSPWVVLLLAPIVGGVLAFLIASMLFRGSLRTHFFSLATFALGEIALFAVSNVKWLGGGQGLLIPPSSGVGSMQFTSRTPYLMLAFGLLVLGLCAVHWIRQSSFGHRLVAVREEEDAAEALGIDARKVKIRAFVLSATLGSVGGVVYGQYIGFIAPKAVLGQVISIQVVLFCILGGVGRLWGPVIGTAILYPISDELRSRFSGSVPGSDLILFGLILVVAVQVMPDGVLGLRDRIRARLRGRRLRLREAGIAAVDDAISAPTTVEAGL